MTEKALEKSIITAEQAKEIFTSGQENNHKIIGAFTNQLIQSLENILNADPIKHPLIGQKISDEMYNTLKNKTNDMKEVNKLDFYNTLFDNRLGTVWKNKLTEHNINKNWNSAKQHDFSETFAEFGRWILTADETTKKILKEEIAPTSYAYVEKQINSFLENN